VVSAARRTGCAADMSGLIEGDGHMEPSQSTRERRVRDASRHEGSVVVVTGAAHGIGRATAVRLAEEGATVVGCDVNQEGLDETLRHIRDAGRDAKVVRVDVTKQAEVDQLIESTESEHGRVDVLANVAGIMDDFLPAHEVDDATWQRVMAVNVTGPMMLCRKVLAGMKERKSGAIVNVASAAGLRAGMTRAIAWTYLTEGIRCNAICPGAVDTGMPWKIGSEWGFERMQGVLSFMGTTRMADADEMSTLISWLACDEASYISGAIVTADAAWGAG
jgi:NAD(P)-dependent dehydrogenase (short-subunit alcohol dehydrogenase family)